MSIKTEYKGIEIEYKEYNDKWWYDGAPNDYTTLTLCKQSIDRFVKKDFEQFDIYFAKNRINVEVPELVTVTSFYGDNEVFIKQKNGKKSKENINSLYLINTTNASIIKELTKSKEDYQEYREQRDKIEIELFNKLIPYKNKE